MRTNRMMLLVRILFLSLLLAISPLIAAQQGTWKDWNYYQLLGLQPEDYYYTSGRWAIKSRRERAKERRQIQIKDIKKAYRKQAQAWHPDKIITRKNQQEQGKRQDQTNNPKVPTHSIDYSNISVEECNERFSKIAEAYEILSDEEDRRDYDEYLLQMEDSMQEEYKRRERMENQQFAKETSFDTRRETTYQSKFADTIFDAASVFEDFFFGSSGSSKSKMEDIFDAFFTTGGSKKYSHRQPDRMSETTQVRYDPKYRRRIVQVLQKEEFDEPSRNRIYYRVIAQEFFEEVDFYGRVIGYIPISDPTVVEEGETPLRKEQYKQNHGRSKSNHGNYRRRVMKRNSHRMERNEYITPRSAFLRSVNGEYYARLTTDCELVVMHDEGEFREDTFVWSSGTYLPPQHRGKGCALAMYGPRIAIVIGDIIDDPSTILWSSPSPPPIVPGSSFEGEEVIDFYCSLDGDGSIAVYRTRKKVELSVNGNDLWSIAQMWWSDLIGGEPLAPPNTHAAAKWKSIQRWALLKTTGRPSTRRSSGRGKKSPYESDEHIDECVFATGLAGCVTPGRYAINISKQVKRSIKKAVVQLDEKVGDFVDSLYDVDEDDTDLLDTFLRVVSKAGTSLGDQVNKSIPDGILVVQKIAHRIGKWLMIFKYELIDYVEKISLRFRETTNILTELIREKYDDVVDSWEL